MALTHEQMKQACYNLDLNSIEAGCIFAGDKETLIHVHYIMDWVKKHMELQ